MPDSHDSAPMRITKPGVYEGLPEEVYHANCTPQPALSASFAACMLARHPARAWYDSPLNPDFQLQTSNNFDIGKAAHLLFLEPECFDARVVLVKADDYRTNAAKEARDQARLARKVPLLPHEAEMVAGMCRALRNETEGLPFSTAPRFAKQGFSGGKAETSYFWQSDGGIWMKARPDYIRPHVIIDYKTAAAADEVAIGRTSARMSWDIRSAVYLEGHKALTDEEAEYFYVIQEKTAPYFVEVVKLDGESMEWGETQLRAAKALFRRCLSTGKWPANNEAAKIVGLPPWAQMRLQDRKDRGDFDTKGLLQTAQRFQAPLDQEF